MVDDSHSDSNALFSGSTSGALRLALYTMAAVALLVADHHGRYVDTVKDKLSVLTYPFLTAVQLPVRAARWVGDSVSQRQELMSRTEELERRLLLTQAQVNRMEALEAENQRLRDLLESSPKLGDRVLVAELLDVDLDPFSHRVVLNKGTSSGVYVGQPVADAGGILGQIEQAGPLSAFAVLISDPNHAIPVAINRTGLRTIAYGTGQTTELVLRDVPASADVIQGDLIVASGLGGRFPRGFPVGEVTRIDNQSGNTFITVWVDPSAALDRSREVLLVWPGDHRLANVPEPEQP
ncbi:MAG: rod shape-determining protein MreC [Xanthomonadales bacterium]|nr:rod shape-determining protein MreC [Xanthomonadales bacterium]